jgi:hypothetical protein
MISGVDLSRSEALSGPARALRGLCRPRLDFASALSPKSPRLSRCLTVIYYSLGFVLLVLTYLVWRWRLPELHGTTLLAPWSWTWLALMTVALAELLVHGLGAFNAPWTQPLRFAAACALFCPTISLLGAKRPQDGAWNFVVVTLWGVLALPALEVGLLGRGEDLQLQDVRAWFLWILIGLEFSHRLGTRYWPVSVLWAAGQSLLLARYLPLVRWDVPESVRPAVLLIPFLGMTCQLRRLPVRPPSWDRLWLDFRDLFGVAWSLRVMERTNAAAERYRWPFRLHWHGLESVEDQRGAESPPWPADVAPTLEQTMRNLLRRFASDAWISARIPVGPPPSNCSLVDEGWNDEPPRDNRFPSDLSRPGD